VRLESWRLDHTAAASDDPGSGLSGWLIMLVWNGRSVRRERRHRVLWLVALPRAQVESP